MELVQDDLMKQGFCCLSVIIVKEKTFLLSRDVYVGVCDRALAVYDISGEKCRFVKSWLLLTKMQRSSGRLSLHWGGFRFKCVLSDLSVLSLLSQVLQRILLASELQRIGIEAMDFPMLAPTVIGFLARLRERCRLDKLEGSGRRFHPVALYAQPTLSLAGCSRAHLAFECLPLLPSLRSLTVPAAAGSASMLRDLVAFAAEPSGLCHRIRRTRSRPSPLQSQIGRLQLRLVRSQFPAFARKCHEFMGSGTDAPPPTKC
jgi:hypothetical protein